MKKWTMREWLLAQAILAGADVFLATEAVYSTAIEHPEWDLNQLKTWEEWERSNEESVHIQ